MNRPLMRPTTSLISSRQRLSFQQQHRKAHSSSFPCIKSKLWCMLLVVMSAICIVLCVLYRDVAIHGDGLAIGNSDDAPPAIIISEQHQQQADADAVHEHTHNSDTTTTHMHSLDLSQNNNFIHLLHRRSLGFSLEDHEAMQTIMHEYAQFAHAMITHDVERGELQGRYIILTPAAQMCNRMRAFMGTVLLAVLTRRTVFIDIGAEGYAARFSGLFIDPGWQWELHSIPNTLKTLLRNAPTKRWSFPYEDITPGHAVHGVLAEQVCGEWKDETAVWAIDSHAAFLPVMARNYNLAKRGLETGDASQFDYKFATHFMNRSGSDGQEHVEQLEVLLARMLFRLEPKLQFAVDTLIRDTYTKAFAYYTQQGVDMSAFDMDRNPPPVVGIHIRSEYVLLMNPSDCRGNRIEKCVKPYEWFEACGVAALDNAWTALLHGVSPYLFVAADTKEAQNAAANIFGAQRIYFRPFENTGGSFKGIQEAMIDLVSVSSMDAFVGTPHSSYSEMSSILSQPRRMLDTQKTDSVHEFAWRFSEIEPLHRVPLNRMIVPVMTTIGWEIEKLNKYTAGRVVDIDIDDARAIFLPQTKDRTPDYQKHRVCKQSVTAGMGWMDIFDMLQNVACYREDWHHPENNGFRCLIVRESAS